MLKKLKTNGKGNALSLSKGSEESANWLLSSLTETESNTREMIGYIGELLSKKQKVQNDLMNTMNRDKDYSKGDSYGSRIYRNPWCKGK